MSRAGATDAAATDTAVTDAAVSDAAVEAVLSALAGLRYGSVDIQVHDAQVVKIMRSEKIRCFDDGVGETGEAGVR